MRDRHRPRLCGSCQAPIAREDDACWRCVTPWGGRRAPIDAVDDATAP
jgi:predicted amidophosphoribosyltransferase